MIGHRVKLKLVSFALALAFAAGLSASGFAEEAGSQPPTDAKATSSERQSPESPAAGENAAPASRGGTTEDIDTRITVQPHGAPAGRFGRVGATNPIVPIKVINPHRRTFSASRAANRFAPNASGVPAPQRQNLQKNFGERFEYQGPGQRPAIGWTGGVGGGGVGLAKPGSTLGHQQNLQPTGISPLGANAKTLPHGGIGGASITHHAVGIGSAGIGGPARAKTGLNGTLMRDTH
jgi:hypothetical protein